MNVEEGRRLANELGAVAYVECSALTQEGMKNVFDEVTKREISFVVRGHFLILSLSQALMAALNKEDEEEQRGCSCTLQ